MLDWASEWRPTHVVVLGDFVDCYHMSKYVKRQGLPSTAVELSEGRKVRAALDSLGAEHKYFLLGNHEHRLYEKLEEAGLAGMVDWPNDCMLGLASAGWLTIPYGDRLRLGNLHFIHDAGPAGKNGTQQTLDFMGCNVIHGHTHRGRTIYQGDGLGRTHMAMCPGWMGDYTQPHMSYEKNILKTKAWTQGFGAVNMDLNGDFVAQLVPIVF